MALRAGYYGLKRFERNKLSTLAASMPADISPDNPIVGKNDVLATVDLLNDTTGWLGGNKWKNDVRTASVFGVTGNVNSNEQIVLTGTFTGDTANVILFGTISLKKGTYKLKGHPGNNAKIALQVYKAGVLNVYDRGNGGEFILNSDTSNILLRIYIDPGVTISDSFTMSPLLLTEEEYNISPEYRPYHESVEELINSYSDITDVYTASFNDFVGKYKKLGPVYTFTCEGTKIGTSWNAFTIKGFNTPIESHLFLGKDNLDLNWYAINNGSDVIVQCRILTDQSEKSTFSGSMILVPTSANREISEPEPVTKKVTKKKVIKEEEE